MGVTRPIMRSGRKFTQVVEGAREIFLAEGFEGANVDDIARAAGVSKATLYSYFPDKRLLFMEVARAECQRQADAAMQIVQPGLPPRDLLLFGARAMTEFFNSPMSLSIFRMCVAEAERFPEMAREFYRNGPMMARDMLAEYLRCATGDGLLAVDDPELAAEQFAELCKAGIFNRRLFGIEDELTAEWCEKVAQSAVDMFMARYGVTE
ncbi:TetR family transcriptional regulator [Primorskyibacter flagellatus]|uniref:TetR family transcriptional regulator n=1 Tax=Primorskyibacter flagellatus TaxID=1387277 RepID=A0A917AC89_9RHOB|nr:TetR/AcrR family transcriptional regulator [Primorskyibacter flagellatus]GGE42830.1 TetR family transcriptional regulator [Primorskyibacter flagellatus]